MCGCIFKAKRLFLALLLCIGCTAVSNPASAVVCFLPDAEGCGDNGINYTPVICDGTNNFTQELCDVTADNYSSKERHYFCVEEGTGCYVLDYTPCFESTDEEPCPGCLNEPKNEQYNCITTIQGLTHHLCSDKGLSYDESDSRTQYLCREKEYKKEGCESFELDDKKRAELGVSVDFIDADTKSSLEATNDFLCNEDCTWDLYVTNYDGDWNRYGSGDTVYGCHKKEACEHVESECSDVQKFVPDDPEKKDEYDQICGVCKDKDKCTNESDCSSDQKFIPEDPERRDDYDNICGECKPKTECAETASKCKGEQTFEKDGTTDDYGNECGTCKDPDKKTCAQLNLKIESECDSANQKFNPTQKDDEGTQCGTCDDKTTCAKLGRKTESECTKANKKFTADSPEVKDDYGTVCGGCDDMKDCKAMGYSTAAEVGTNQKFVSLDPKVYDDYKAECGDIKPKDCVEIDKTFQIEKQCKANEKFDKNGTEGGDGACGKCNPKTCKLLNDDYLIITQCNNSKEACYTGFAPNGEVGSDGACGKCAPKCNEGYELNLTNCDNKTPEAGTVLLYRKDSCTHNVVCGKCEPCKLNTCSGYTYTTLSDYANSESCDLGCSQGKKYRCKDGYDYKDGKCVAKEATCSYTYFEATVANTRGVTGNLDDNFKCARGTDCFSGLSEVESIVMGAGFGSVMPIFNKISNKSDSCVRNGTTYYETLCTGTPKERCQSGKTFTPNGCVSNAYNHGYEVKGTQWGTCGCDTARGKYDTSDACKKSTGKGCTYVNYCYQTCESQGYYSTEAACKSGLPKDAQCLAPGNSKGNSSCYVRYLPGFAIRYASTPNRTWSCDPRGGGTSTQQTFRAWLLEVRTESNGSHQPGSYVETIDGHAYAELSDNEYRYEAGTYFVCVSNGAAYSNAPVGVRKAVVQYTRSANGADPTTHVCFADTISSQFSNTECLKSTSWGSGYSCREVTFSEGVLYLVSIYGDYGYPGWTYDMGTCTNY